MLEPRLIKEKKSYSSLRNPAKEISAWLAETLPHVPKDARIAVLGLGDGQHIRQLLNMGYINLSVLEFDPWVISCFETFHKDLLESYPSFRVHRLYGHSYFEDDFSGYDYFLPFRSCWHNNAKIFSELYSCLMSQGSILNYHQNLEISDQSKKAKAIRALVSMGLKSGVK